MGEPGSYSLDGTRTNVQLKNSQLAKFYEVAVRPFASTFNLLLVVFIKNYA